MMISASFRVPGKQGYLVDIGMRFLPKGVTVNNSKVMISQAGRLRPGEHGADKTGKWAKSLSLKRDNIQKLLVDAIDCLSHTNGFSGNTLTPCLLFSGQVPRIHWRVNLMMR